MKVLYRGALASLNVSIANENGLQRGLLGQMTWNVQIAIQQIQTGQNMKSNGRMG